MISRKNTILMAALVNIAILAVLLMTARYGEDEPKTAQTNNDNVAEAVPLLIETISTDAPQEESSAKETQPSDSPTSPEQNLSLGDEKKGDDSSIGSAGSTPSNPPAEEKSYVEITVKRGDSLDKIARANGTTIEEIKKINHLASDRLDIGQVLKVPTSQAKKVAYNTNTKVKNDPNDKNAVYVTVKPGDSPWKIARQNNVRYEDILRLNGLTEDSARNLKVGDRIRVK